MTPREAIRYLKNRFQDSAHQYPCELCDALYVVIHAMEEVEAYRLAKKWSDSLTCEGCPVNRECGSTATHYRRAFCSVPAKTLDTWLKAIQEEEDPKRDE